MPLPERVITPVNLSRGTLSCPVPDELEGVTNGTLANIIRQLSSLSRHAEEMFGNLFSDAESVAIRSSDLQARIDRLAIKVTQLDSNVEEVSLQDIQLRKVFRSSQNFDQQVVSRETMPKALLAAYVACDRPPPLDKLNPYRDDGKDGLKFYTDPNYFFDLWRQEMLKGTERMINDRGKKNPSRGLNSSGGGSGQKSERHKKRVRVPQNSTERIRMKVMAQGEYLLEQDPNGTEQQHYHPHHQTEHQQPYFDERTAVRPNSIEIKRSYVGHSAHNEPIYTPRILRNDFSENGVRDDEYEYRESTPSRRPSQPPPAPPSASSPSTSLPFPPSPLELSNGHDSPSRKTENRDLPPPPPIPLAPSPPPPPPEAFFAPPPPPPPPPPTTSNGLLSDIRHSTVPRNIPTSMSPLKNLGSPPMLTKIPAFQDGVRSDLLKAIRDGIALKKVEQSQECHVGGTSVDSAANQTDVAFILARRMAVEMSDSDDGVCESESDSDDWGDESNA